MRISLISPKWDQMVLSYPPLGLAYLAAALEREGHRVKIHVFSLTPDSSLGEDVSQVCDFHPELVGITSMTNVHYAAENLAQALKHKLGCPLVMGGPHPTALPARTLANPNVDFVITGEGEATLVELARALESDLPLGDIRGLCFKANGQPVINEPRPLVQSLDEIPFPARHLLDLEKFPLRAQNGELMATVLTSRGCPYECSYCFKGLFGRRYRQRSVANVIAELEEVKARYGIRSFYFIDDLFTTNTRWLMEFSRALIDRRLDLRWQCLARVDRVSPEILALAYQAGCREVHYGIESGNQRILDRVSKHISLDGVREAISWTRQAGMIAKGYFMVGLPGDTEETIQETIEFCLSLDLDDAMFSITTPFPGTRLWGELVAKQPHPEMTQDFTKAYYYTVNAEIKRPFLNVSEVSDDRLAELAYEAVARFESQRSRRRLCRAYGRSMGTVAWHLSKFGVLRKVGRRIVRLCSRLSNRRGHVTGEYAELWA